MRVRHRDLNSLRSIVHALYERTHLSDLPSTVLRLASPLIPCDGMTFACHDRASAALIGHIAPSPANLAGFITAYNRHSADHPSMVHYARTGMPGATKITDFITARQFRETGLYREVYRDLGWKTQMGYGYFRDALTPLVTLSFTRGPRDFTDEETFLTMLLGPHVLRAYLDALALPENGSNHVLYFDHEGHIVHASPGAPALFCEYFGPEAQERVPPEIVSWAVSERARIGASDFSSIHRAISLRTFDGSAGRLVVRILIVSGIPHHGLFFRHEPHFVAENLRLLPLTKREREVLLWITEGKTNEEIAIILGMKKRTAEKHVGNILEKLGVENRTAAAAMARSVGLRQN